MPDERSRHQLHEELSQLMSPASADELFDYLPPVGWADVATRTDVAMIRTEMDALRADLRGEMAQMRGELKGDIGELRGQFGELRGQFGELRGEFGKLEGRMGSFEAMMERKFRHQTIWLFGLISVATAVLAVTGR